MRPRSREFSVRHERSQEGILVRAHSFIGAMRQAFGPGVYKEVGGDQICRRILWEFGRFAEPPKPNHVGPYKSFYIVTLNEF